MVDEAEAKHVDQPEDGLTAEAVSSFSVGMVSQALAGLRNGAFLEPPPNPSLAIDNSTNPLPGPWEFVQSVGSGTISAFWGNDPLSGSLGSVYFDANASAAIGHEAYLEQLVLLTGNPGGRLSAFPECKYDTWVLGAGQFLRAGYLDNAGALVGAEGTSLGGSIPAIPNTSGQVYPTARALRIRIGVLLTQAGPISSGTFYEVFLNFGSTALYTTDGVAIRGYVDAPEQTAPATPASAHSRIYPKADGLWYSKDDAGAEVLMSSGPAGGTFATPAIVLGAAAAAGAASSVIRSDSTIAAFDATNPSTQAFGDAAAVGTAAFAARRDHKHAMPSERAPSSTTPAAVGTAAVGVGTTDARADHVHATGAGTPSTQAFGDAAATGSGPAAAMTDHKHGMPAAPSVPAFATPAIVLGSAAAAGAAGTVIRSDGTIAAFDATVPVTQAFGDAAAVGSAAFAARRDHKHGMPATPTATGTAGGDLAGTYPNPSVVQAAGAFALPGVISPAALSADVDDYNPTGLSTASVIRVDAGAGWTILGLAGGASGRLIVIENVGANNLLLGDDRASSAAANRIKAGGASLYLQPGNAVTLIYDGTSSRWRAMWNMSASGLQTGTLPAGRMPALTGDVTTTVGAVATAIANDAVTYPKMQNVSATDKVLGRATAGAGDVEEIALTAAARTVIDDTTVAAMVDTLGGAASTGSGGLVRTTSPALVTPALGTPASGVATNLTGTAAGLTAGNVTTNANLTGEVTSVGNAATIVGVPGTFTPALTLNVPGTSSIVHSTQVGRYTKFGNRIIFVIVIVTSTYTIGTGSGTLDITGLPFTSAAGNPGYGACIMQGYTKANYTHVHAAVVASSTILRIQAGGSGQAIANLTAADTTSGTQITLRISGEYEV